MTGLIIIIIQEILVFLAFQWVRSHRTQSRSEGWKRVKLPLYSYILAYALSTIPLVGFLACAIILILFNAEKDSGTELDPDSKCVFAYIARFLTKKV